MPKTASSSFVLPFRCRRSNPYDKEEMDSYDSLNDLMEQQLSSPPLSSSVPPPLSSSVPPPLPLPSAAPLPLPISIPPSLPSSVPPPPRPPQKTLSKCVPGVEGSLFEKPLYSYATLIGKAILDTQEKRARLSFIYHWIATRFPFYRLDQGGWQNSIRHNLTVNKCFVKDVDKDDPPGKGSFWKIHDDYYRFFETGIFEKPRNGLSPARTHLYQQAQNIPPLIDTQVDDQCFDQCSLPTHARPYKAKVGGEKGQVKNASNSCPFKRKSSKQVKHQQPFLALSADDGQSCVDHATMNKAFLNPHHIEYSAYVDEFRDKINGFGHFDQENAENALKGAGRELASVKWYESSSEPYHKDSNDAPHPQFLAYEPRPLDSLNPHEQVQVAQVFPPKTLASTLHTVKTVDANTVPLFSVNTDRLDSSLCSSTSTLSRAVYEKSELSPSMSQSLPNLLCDTTALEFVAKTSSDSLGDVHLPSLDQKVNFSPLRLHPIKQEAHLVLQHHHGSSSAPNRIYSRSTLLNSLSCPELVDVFWGYASTLSPSMESVGKVVPESLGKVAEWDYDGWKWERDSKLFGEFS